jgi:uncharacterized protein
VYARYSLVLMVTHACNMRCSYCYTGAKLPRSMPEAVGRKAVDRALASVEQGGTLDLGFFGGEPLLEADRVSSLIAYARQRAEAVGVEVIPGLTTNGTVAGGLAWALMILPELSLAISFDGLPRIHDRHRRFPDGSGSSRVVLDTMRRLREAGKEFRVAMVVRPDTAALLPEGIAFLHDSGVRHVEPSLDVWAAWSASDIARLEAAIDASADVWRDGLPDLSVSWFDEKAALLAGVPVDETPRCGFGDGEMAVAPSGRLYPCERLIGEDDEANPMRLAGHVLDGEDFLGRASPPGRCAEGCRQCLIQAMCNTTCRCCNYVRTGQCGQPDRLLCALNRACARETARVLEELGAVPMPGGAAR